MEFVRVRLNWNVNNPLKFQRKFQFSPGVNTLLRIQYERLCGFCETCGMLTHDSGACLIQNGGAGPNDEDNDSGGEGDEGVEHVPNQGVIIEEINEDVNEGDNAADMGAEGQHTGVAAEIEDPEQEEYVRSIRQMEEEADDDQLWSDEGMQTKLSSDVNRDEMYNPLYPASQHFTKETAEDLGLKRKAWLTSDNGNSTSFFKGETSGTSGAKRKKGYVADQVEQK